MEIIFRFLVDRENLIRGVRFFFRLLLLLSSVCRRQGIFSSSFFLVEERIVSDIFGTQSLDALSINQWIFFIKFIIRFDRIEHCYLFHTTLLTMTRKTLKSSDSVYIIYKHHSNIVHSTCWMVKWNIKNLKSSFIGRV